MTAAAAPAPATSASKWLAEVFAQAGELVRGDHNRLGADIPKRKGWLPHVHDSWRMAREGRAAWVAEIKQRLDLDRTFGVARPQEIDVALADIFDRIITGRPALDDSLEDATPTQSGPANLAKQLHKRRALIFRSTDDWLAYNRRFGFGTVTASMLHYLRNGARQARLLERLGPNPEAMIKGLADAYRRPPRHAAHVDKLAKVQNWGSVRILTGEAFSPGSTRIAAVGQTIRMSEVLSKLGGVLLSSLSDVPSLVGQLRFQGGALLPMWGRTLAGYVQGRGRGQEREIAAALNEGFDGLIDGISSPYAAEDAPVGRLAKVTQTFFRWTGLTGFTDTGRSVFARIMAAEMGRASTTAFADLDIRLRNVLEQHGIGPTAWDAIRAQAWDGDGGRRYLTPDRVRDIPDEVIDAIVGDELDGIAEAMERSAELAGRAATAADEAARKARTGAPPPNIEVGGPDAAAYREARRVAGVLGILGDIERLSFDGRSVADIVMDLGLEQRIAGTPGERAQLVQRVQQTLGIPDQADGQSFAIARAEYLRRIADPEMQAKANALRRKAERSAERAWQTSERAGPIAERVRQEKRLAFELALRRLYADEAGGAVVEIGPHTQAITTGGLAKGTPWGEAARIVMQFKGFPLAFTHRVLGRRLYGGPDYGSAGQNVLRNGLHMGELMATLFVAGLLSTWAKDIARGRTPKSLTEQDGSANEATILAALLQSGGLGIYGDFLFAQNTRFGGSPLESAFGPAVGDIGQAVQLLLAARDGEAEAASAVNLALGNTPFINHFVARPALDILFLNSLRETVSPGFARRQEAKLRADYGQERLFWRNLGEIGQ